MGWEALLECSDSSSVSEDRRQIGRGKIRRAAEPATQRQRGEEQAEEHRSKRFFRDETEEEWRRERKNLILRRITLRG